MTQPTEDTSEESAIGEAPPVTPTAADASGILRMLIADGGNKAYLYHLNQAITAFEQGGESKESKRGS